MANTAPNPNARAERRDFRQEVTDSVIRMLEEGVAPWQKPWDSSVGGMPFNPTTGKPYRGGNAVNLLAIGLQRGYSDPRWMTYKQAAANGWQVRQGEKGSHIEFWDVQPGAAESAPATATDPQRADEAHRSGPRLIQRVYTVFNAAQIDGIPPYTPVRRTPFEVVEAGEPILLNSGAALHHDQRDRAFYNRATDSIHLPPKEAFNNAEQYYGTALHELAHWSGAPNRLNRATLGESYRFGDTNYAREELRAELASLFLAAERGIPHDPVNHAAYIGSWIAALRNDKNEIFRASHDASAATDFLLSFERDRSREEALETETSDVASLERGSGPDAVAHAAAEGDLLRDETGQLENDRDLADAGEPDAAPAETAPRRESTRQVSEFDPGTSTVHLHDKQTGADQRTPVSTAVGDPDGHSPNSAEAVKQSFAAAEVITVRALGESARTFEAFTDGGLYRGQIIGETDQHLVQRVSSRSAVAHRKDLLDSTVGIGANVLIAYSNSFARVKEVPERGRSQELGR